MSVKLAIKKLDHGKNLPLPAYATKDSAGMDLMAAIIENITIEAGTWKLIPTGISIELETGYEAQIRPRSGLAYKFGVTVLNAPGTIDADYRGEVCVLLINHSKTDFVVTPEMRIAQMIIAKVEQAEVSLKTELSDTERGSSGFGSTGLHNKNKEAASA